ncbi:MULTISPECIES: transposase [Okeania]|uniref:transposase n=1 Tax=Okeania TaxID=1458928 RepID=UPI001960B8FD|nr:MULTISPECIES: transposase [Okeania]
MSKSINDAIWGTIPNYFDCQNGYHPQKIMEELKKVAPAILTNIPLKLSPKPLKAQKNQQGKTGFVPVTARWVIERTNSWMERCNTNFKKYCYNRIGIKLLSDRHRVVAIA